MQHLNETLEHTSETPETKLATCIYYHCKIYNISNILLQHPDATLET
jgi:hypothetical protein